MHMNNESSLVRAHLLASVLLHVQPSVPSWAAITFFSGFRLSFALLKFTSIKILHKICLRSLSLSLLRFALLQHDLRQHHIVQFRLGEGVLCIVCTHMHDNCSPTGKGKDRFYYGGCERRNRIASRPRLVSPKIPGKEQGLRKTKLPISGSVLHTAFRYITKKQALHTQYVAVGQQQQFASFFSRKPKQEKWGQRKETPKRGLTIIPANIVLAAHVLVVRSACANDKPKHWQNIFDRVNV